MPRIKSFQPASDDIDIPKLKKEPTKHDISQLRKFVEDCIKYDKLNIVYNFVQTNKRVVYLTDIEGTNCLYWCLQYNDRGVDPDFILYLLKLGSDPGAYHIMKKNTPVHMACRRKWIPWYVVLMMVTANENNTLDLLMKDDYKKLPLHHLKSQKSKERIMGSECPRYEAEKILLERGFRTIDNWTSSKYV